MSSQMLVPKVRDAKDRVYSYESEDATELTERKKENLQRDIDEAISTLKKLAQEYDFDYKDIFDDHNLPLSATVEEVALDEDGLFDYYKFENCFLTPFDSCEVIITDLVAVREEDGF